MKFKISEYCGSPAWRITGRWVYFDAEWNTCWPFGTCLCLRVGPYRPWPSSMTHRQPVRGFTLDLNAPLGEPNRLYLWGRKRQYTIGLISWHDFRETGDRGPVAEGEYLRCRPRLVRAQAWNRARGEVRPWDQDDSWRWITVYPDGWQCRQGHR